MEATITMVALVLQISLSGDVLRTNRITKRSVCPDIHHLGHLKIFKKSLQLKLNCTVCDYMLAANSKACRLPWEAGSARAECVFEQHVT